MSETLPAIEAGEVERALSDPRQPRLVFQPVVDLVRGVAAGYEALARFDSEPYRSPDQWFAAGARLGCGAQLEARVVRQVLAARELLTAGCFLTANITPNLLAGDAVQRVVHGQPLHRLVFELTEHVPYAGTAGRV